jgi:hypothetical protein
MGGDGSGRGGWRNPYDHRRLVTVSHVDPGRYELTILPGADVHDLVDVTAALPSVVYTDHRAVAPSDPGAVLTFRAMPAGPDGVAVRPSSLGGPSGWVPTVGPVAAEIPPSDHEEALRKILASGAFGRHGWLLILGLVHCDPDAVVAAADGIREAWARRQ